MAAPTITDIKAAFAIDSAISDGRLTFCLDGAIREVKLKIGYDAWTEIFEGVTSTVVDSDLDTDTTNVNETQMRIDAVTDAVLYFAMAKVLVNANLRIRKAGQVKREQDTGSPGGMGGGGQITNEYLTPAEVSQWRASLLAEAESLIGPYEVAEGIEVDEEFAVERG